MSDQWMDAVSAVARRDLAGGRHSAGRAATCLALLSLSIAFMSASAQTAGAHWSKISLTPSKTEPYYACPPTEDRPVCQMIIVPTPKRADRGPQRAGAAGAGSPAYEGGGFGGGLSPANLRSAYGLTSASEADGSGQTIAVIDAYDDATAETDMNHYREKYGIPACGSGCFTKVNQEGGTAEHGEKFSEEWIGETSLDLDMVSAICPNCHILLVEANNEQPLSLLASDNEAVKLGATELSDSWAFPETGSYTEDNSYVDHPGIPIAAAGGDQGYEVKFPASSPYVIAVGGTILQKASNSRGWEETAWPYTGSGCSKYQPKPSWQTASPSCAYRTTNDVAADASRETSVSVYDSYYPLEENREHWGYGDGTSAATPIVASTMALANAYTKSLPGAEALYLEALQNGTGVLDDIVSGSNGSCGGSYLCTAGVGYDGPTGLGSLWGVPTVTQTLPTATTEAATGIQQTEATLHASVNPNGPEAEYYFEYGTTTSYGSSTNRGHVGYGTKAVAESATIIGLKPGTTYHYRIVASSPGVTVEGSDQILTTLVEPNVFFVDANHGNTMTDRWENSSGWLQTRFEGDEITKATSPSALMVNGEANVFFADASKSNTITDRWDSVALGGWTQTNFGGDEVAKGTSPFALIVNGETNVFFVDANKSDTITDRWDSVALGGWTQTNLGGDEVAKGTSPSAIMVGREVNVFFVDASQRGNRRRFHGEPS